MKIKEKLTREYEGVPYWVNVLLSILIAFLGIVLTLELVRLF